MINNMSARGGSASGGKKVLLNCFIALLLFGSFFMVANSVWADGILPNPSKCTVSNYSGTNCGDYTLNDFIQIAINISGWILSIVGSLALLMFIYGGIMFLISSGSSERVTKAKGIIIAAVIGLIIVFTSFTIIKFVMQAMGINWNGGG